MLTGKDDATDSTLVLIIIFSSFNTPLKLGFQGEVGEIPGVESSPEYMVNPLAPYRMRMVYPHAKIIVLLRDPTDR